MGMKSPDYYKRILLQVINFCKYPKFDIYLEFNDESKLIGNYDLYGNTSDVNKQIIESVSPQGFDELVLSNNVFDIKVVANNSEMRKFKGVRVLKTTHPYGNYGNGDGQLRSDYGADVFYPELAYSNLQRNNITKKGVVNSVYTRPFMLPVILDDYLLLPSFDNDFVSGELYNMNIRGYAVDFIVGNPTNTQRVEIKTVTTASYLSNILLKYNNNEMYFNNQQKLVIGDGFVSTKTYAGLVLFSCLSETVFEKYLMDKVSAELKQYLERFDSDESHIFVLYKNEDNSLHNEDLEQLVDIVNEYQNFPKEMSFIKRLRYDEEKVYINHLEGRIFIYEKPYLIDGVYKTGNKACAFLSSVYSLAVQLYEDKKSKQQFVSFNEIFSTCIFDVLYLKNFVKDVNDNQVTIQVFNDTKLTIFDSDFKTETNTYYSLKRLSIENPTKNGLYEVHFTLKNGTDHYIVCNYDTNESKYYVVYDPANIYAEGSEFTEIIKHIRETIAIIGNRTKENYLVDLRTGFLHEIQNA